MRPTPWVHMEIHRVTGHPDYVNARPGEPRGFFQFKWSGNIVRCMVGSGLGWEHISVSTYKKAIPSWEIMCRVKDLFWLPEETVVQYHPAKADYVNDNPYVLHLWRWTDGEFPKPPKWMVGRYPGYEEDIANDKRLQDAIARGEDL